VDRVQTGLTWVQSEFEMLYSSQKSIYHDPNGPWRPFETQKRDDLAWLTTLNKVSWPKYIKIESDLDKNWKYGSKTRGWSSKFKNPEHQTDLKPPNPKQEQSMSENWIKQSTKREPFVTQIEKQMDHPRPMTFKGQKWPSEPGNPNHPWMGEPEPGNNRSIRQTWVVEPKPKSQTSKTGDVEQQRSVKSNEESNQSRQIMIDVRPSDLDRKKVHCARVKDQKWSRFLLISGWLVCNSWKKRRVQGEAWGAGELGVLNICKIRHAQKIAANGINTFFNC